MDEALFQKALKIYKEHYTENVRPPDCSECNEPAELYDQGSGENFCDRCFVESMRKDEETLMDYVKEHL